MIEEHLGRLEYQLLGHHNLDAIASFITKHTYIKGSLYSFDGHEFQRWIAEDTHQESNVQKISQVGLSEIMARWVVAAVATIPYLSVIYTMPYAGDAEKFAKTRVDPIVDDAPKLLALKSRQVWNSSIKQLGQGMIYFRGTNSETAAISVPADVIIADEIDRSNPDVLDQFESRLTHSKWQIRRNFSTPTVEKRGIDLKMRSSKRFKNFCQCDHCNHWFYPDYYQHVRIPGFDGELSSITKDTLRTIRWQEAFLYCPKCFAALDVRKLERSLICENATENWLASGYYVSPFDAANIVTLPQLVKKSTGYRRISEFHNQNLGICSEEKEDTITMNDLEACRLQSKPSMSYNSMGCDMGMVCNITIGKYVDDVLVVCHAERVLLKDFESRRLEFIQEFNVISKVQDALPYTDMLFRLQGSEPTLYGAYYTSLKDGCYTITEPEEDENKTRAVKINRTVAFDNVLYLFKKGLIRAFVGNEWDIFTTQLQDMKKVPKFNDKGEAYFVWEKSEEGNDHYHLELWPAPLASVSILKQFKTPGTSAD